MDSRAYIEQAKVTESQDFAPILDRLKEPELLRMLHAAMGISTEAGELLDAIKKHVYYGKSLDRTNLVEEMGDAFWYLAILADSLGVDFESVMQKNIEKLQVRYGDKFSAARAIHRNLSNERQSLES
jgi:NTP pyrophosphatase (non-canonical NTP hydrolase)